MLRTLDNFSSPSGSGFTVVEGPADNDGARIVFDRVMPPGKGQADPHLHLDCDQHYEIQSGSATVEVEGTQRTLLAGERLDIARGTVHRDPYNASEAELRFRVKIEPCPPFIDAFGRALAEGYQTGELTDQDELPVLKILVLTRAFNGESYRGGMPVGLQRAMLPLLAVVGRLRGYRPPELGA